MIFIKEQLNSLLLYLVIKCILIASPGFVKDHFYEYLFQQAIKLDNKVLLENRSKFVLCHSSSGFKHSLKGITNWSSCFNNNKLFNSLRGFVRSTITITTYWNKSSKRSENTSSILHDAAKWTKQSFLWAQTCWKSKWKSSNWNFVNFR